MSNYPYPALDQAPVPRSRRPLTVPRWFAILAVGYTAVMTFALTLLAGSVLAQGTPLLLWLIAATAATCVARGAAAVAARAMRPARGRAVRP
ncbi:hypothetical protein QBL07_024410 (plasmid) [Gordonia rubripertincta]|uniref:Uncharacterized protein n=2 Tax=Gordonia rubripertincta TaxID=36822 RepID=A0AAW6RFD8_GORRU|nr:MULTISPECIES: hypothetical protein [Gordonia]MDG6783151.1 hypothetical protein [Gordonia rubripertincta]NKY65438.1 hypothetical protein [Gordonia rubripertincta]GAB86903.1 hypothetical protein GORBP_083_00540 [Gordonia rubripertincta NBRC 101908]